jgi:hypothetical protein
MSAQDKTVMCGTHGNTPVTYACRHIAAGIACGFRRSDEDPSDRWPDAWCDYCEERVSAAGEWTPELAADVKILCTHCWDDSRARNETVPALARGRAARLTAEEKRRLLHGAVHDTTAKQEAAHARWNIGLGANTKKAMSWFFDADGRTLTFSEEGTPRVVADVRLVGSYSTTSDSFQWSWVLYPHDEPMIRGVDRLPAFGEVRGVEELTRQWWECEIAEAWEMTSVAAYLLGSEAVYRAPFDHVFWFMLLSHFREVA